MNEFLQTLYVCVCVCVCVCVSRMCLRVTYIEQQASSSLQASDGGGRRRASCSRTIRSMMYRCMVNCMMGHHDVYVSRVCVCACLMLGMTACMCG